MIMEKSEFYISCLGNLCYLTRGNNLYPPVLFRVTGIREVEGKLYFMFKELR